MNFFNSSMNFFNSSKPKTLAVSPRSSDLICGRNHGGMISATDVKTTLIKFASWLLLTTAISSCMNPSDPHKLVPGESISGGPVTNFRPKPDDVVQPTLLPDIGKWMLDPDLTPAHWIGEVYYGKTLREPINIIIVDQVANSPEEAKRHSSKPVRQRVTPVVKGTQVGIWDTSADNFMRNSRKVKIVLFRTLRISLTMIMAGSSALIVMKERIFSSAHSAVRK